MTFRYVHALEQNLPLTNVMFQTSPGLACQMVTMIGGRL